MQGIVIEEGGMPVGTASRKDVNPTELARPTAC